MNRPRTHTRQKGPPRSLRGFPICRPRPPYWRTCLNRFADNPWWFDDGVGGRFNPVGTGQGACYLGLDQLAGLIEVLGPEMIGGVIHKDDLIERSVVDLPACPRRGLGIANLASRSAIGFGVTNVLAATASYRLPHQWAAAFAAAGYAGIRYRTRFDTGSQARGIALFGPPGRNPHGWLAPTKRIPATRFETALRRTCHIEVIVDPPLSALPAAPNP